MTYIHGYQGLYSINENGEIYSHITNRFLKTATKDSYSNVRLCKNGVYTPFKVHSLVAKSFIPNPHDLKEVNHKNGVKGDNRSVNLEWCSRSENIKHSYRELNRKRVSGVDHPKYRPVLNMSTGIFFDSCSHAAYCHGLTRDKVKNGIRSGNTDFTFC